MKRVGSFPPHPLRATAGACAVFLGLLAYFLDGPGAPRSTREVFRQESPTLPDRSTADRVGGVHAPIDAQRPGAGERLPAAIAESTERPRALEERIRASVSVLARALEDDPFDRRDWETRAAATASSLGPLAAPELNRIAGRPEVGGAELVAATELLRALRQGVTTPGGALPARALARLRAEAARTDSNSSVRVAASRSLGAFGERADLRELVGRMAASEDPEERSLASWALDAGSRRRVTACVAELLSADPTPEAVERSLCFLSTRPEAPGPDLRDPGASALVTETARRILRDENANESLRTRALLVLAAFAPDEAREDLIDVLCSSEEPVRVRRRAAEALLRRRAAGRVSDAEQLLGSPDLSGESRRMLAEEILRAGSPPGSSLHAHAAREEALDVVEETVLDGGHPLRQRSALQALATDPTPRASRIIDRVLRGDPGPAVRAAARPLRDR